MRSIRCTYRIKLVTNKGSDARLDTSSTDADDCQAACKPRPALPDCKYAMAYTHKTFDYADKSLYGTCGCMKPSCVDQREDSPKQYKNEMYSITRYLPNTLSASQPPSSGSR